MYNEHMLLFNRNIVMLGNGRTTLTSTASRRITIACDTDIISAAATTKTTTGTVISLNTNSSKYIT